MLARAAHLDELLFGHDLPRMSSARDRSILPSLQPENVNGS
jgi:hypothetical protein